MNSVELPFETWRAVIDLLRAKGLPYMLEHAEQLERKLDEHPPDAVVRLSLTDDVYLRSYNWARVELGIPLPPPEQSGLTARRRGSTLLET